MAYYAFFLRPTKCQIRGSRSNCKSGERSDSSIIRIVAAQPGFSSCDSWPIVVGGKQQLASSDLHDWYFPLLQGMLFSFAFFLSSFYSFLVQVLLPQFVSRFTLFYIFSKSLTTVRRYLVTVCGNEAF
jgi:hypothetical protein